MNGKKRGKKPHHFLLIDTETTLDNLVADFGAIICDRYGKILAQCAVLIRDVFDKPRLHTLFWNDAAGREFERSNLTYRYDRYHQMLATGERQYATVRALNAWLGKAAIAFNPILTAYHLAFDTAKCANTGIDLDAFEKRFCLMKAAQTHYGQKRKYLEYVLNCHAFNPPRNSRTMTYQTNAEVMSAFVQGHPVIDEPHTALEDVLHHELPILVDLRKKRSTKWLLTEPKGYNWRDYQVRDHFQPKPRGRR